MLHHLTETLLSYAGALLTAGGIATFAAPELVATLAISGLIAALCSAISGAVASLR